MLITYIKGGTPAQIILEKGSAMTRATFVIFLSSFFDWCYTQVSYAGSWEPLVILSDELASKPYNHSLR